jgi:hypothetical protein
MRPILHNGRNTVNSWMTGNCYDLVDSNGKSTEILAAGWDDDFSGKGSFMTRAAITLPENGEFKLVLKLLKRDKSGLVETWVLRGCRAGYQFHEKGTVVDFTFESQDFFPNPNPHYAQS